MFRGTFDHHPWADNGRNRFTGEVTSPFGPAHVRRLLADGSYDPRPQIAHRLAAWVSEARHRAGLTQTHLAARLNTTQAAVAKWETGRTLISLSSLAFLGDVTNAPVAVYFDFGGNPGGRAMWL
jgi:DNA-binding XRE family transcriptional regulator